jgi:hypothetical protein
MTKIRFSTAQQVIDAFPHTRDEFEGQPLGLAPIAFIQHLLQNKSEKKAITFCAFLLSRHDAVKWLCKSLRTAKASYAPKEESWLALSEEWAKAPTEAGRQAAFKAAMASGFRTAPAFAAAAAGWSGGNLSGNADNPVPPPAQLTGQAVKTGLMLSAMDGPISQQADRIRSLVELALTFIEA